MALRLFLHWGMARTEGSNRRTKREQRLLADYASQEGGKANCLQFD